MGSTRMVLKSRGN